jgi:CubicO group peptidase (beta-lactamase class C family)
MSVNIRITLVNLVFFLLFNFAGCNMHVIPEKGSKANTAAVKSEKTGGKTFADKIPDGDWKVSTPEKQGMDSKTLLEMDKHIKEKLPHIRSIVVIRNGYLVFERYYQNYSSEECFEVNSITKSFIGALMGIAIKNGNIKSENQKLSEFFPEYITPDTDPVMKEITLKHLLTMTSGIGGEDRSRWSSSWVKYAMGNRFERKPGEKFQYSDLSANLMSAVITKSTGMNALEFADRYLFKPLGIAKPYWPEDPQGNSMGFRGMRLRTRDMAKFGYLYLNNGVWNDKQIIPKEWIEKSTHRIKEKGFPEDSPYGYFMWLGSTNGTILHSGGYGDSLFMKCRT